MAAVRKSPKVAEVIANTKQNLDAIEPHPSVKIQKEQLNKSLALVKQIDISNLVKQLADMKLAMTSTLDSLGNVVSERVALLEDVEKSIAAQEQQLKQLYSISAEANTLESIIAAQEQLQQSWAEQKLARDKEWQRQQAEHDYEFKQKVKKEQDDWEQNKILVSRKFEEEINKRICEVEAKEKAFSQFEAELINSREQIEQFPKTLEAALAAKEKETEIRCNRENAYKTTIEKKDAEAKAALLHQTMESYAKRIIDLEKALETSLKAQDEAAKRVQQIAEKAIEGASKQQNVVLAQSPTSEYGSGTGKR